MKYLHCILFILFCKYATAQSLSINTDGSTANISALLDVKSTTKGLLLPRMTKAQKNAIATPASGLLVYQTGPDSIGFQYYNGTQWLWLDPLSSNSWKLTGNAGTNITNHFLGTTDDVPLTFRQNNSGVGFLNFYNVFFGNSAGRKNIQNLPASGLQNVAIGNGALDESIKGNGQVAIGAGALADDTTETYVSPAFREPNTAVGYLAMYHNVRGFGNTSLGSLSGLNITDGNYNTAAGVRSLSKADFFIVPNSSSYNAAFGFEALLKVNNADSNAAFGYRALQNNSSGSNNVAIGTQAMDGNTSGNFNTVIGHNADVGSGFLSFATAIGANARVDTSNAIVLGTGPSNIANVGIGTTKPKRLLHLKTGPSFAADFNVNTALLLESSTTNNIEFSSPSTSSTSIISSTNLTAIRSRIAFEPDSSIRFSSGASLFKVMILANNGNLGINTTTPSAKLDVNGTFNLGANGTVNSALIRETVNVDVGSIPANGELDVIIPVANVTTNAVVSVSPSADLLSGIIIAWARVSSPGNVKVRFRNLTGGAINPAAMDFYISALQ